jgi:hypothetical protein
MVEVKYKPVPRDDKAFLAKVPARAGFRAAYDALGLEYQVASSAW